MYGNWIMKTAGVLAMILRLLLWPAMMPALIVAFTFGDVWSLLRSAFIRGTQHN
jgi:hypothetical protein